VAGSSADVWRTSASRWLALTVLCAVTMMIILDGTMVTVALPSIQRSRGFSATGLEWVVTGYLIAFGGLLLLAGRLGDLVGGKRVFLAGLLLFTVASLACGLASSQPALIAARFVQGAGGAAASAVSLGMIVRLFPAPGDQARAMGVYSFVGAGGASLGLVLGGVLTQALSWHWARCRHGLDTAREHHRRASVVVAGLWRDSRHRVPSPTCTAVTPHH
jgi:MFS family permease